MSRVLDLNSIKMPTLELVFTDDAHTTVHVKAPTEGLINELESWAKTGMASLSAEDPESLETIYDLAARLLSCNREGLTISTADLRGKYEVDIWALIAIVNAYTEFISDIKNEKN